MITLPGLIDPHVHLRDPGQTEKEDFYTGTQAALAGGFTTVLDMPNNKTAITTPEGLEAKIAEARKKVVCDIGFHYGSLGDNLANFKRIQKKVTGLKIYLNITTGTYIVDEKVFGKIADAWPKDKPILVHAEEDILEKILEIGKRAKQRIHVCHVSSTKELQIVYRAKENGQTVTCGVTPHHLFLNETMMRTMGTFAKMKPVLKSQKDVDYLWKNLDMIDVIESDHAPHTLSEKKQTAFDAAPYGVPGLETTLPLLLTAAHEGKITVHDIIRLCFENPSRIFTIQPNLNTFIRVDENERWTIKNENLFTKCKWSPFNDWEVRGRVKQVFIRGTKVFENDKIVIQPGFGEIIHE